MKFSFDQGTIIIIIKKKNGDIDHNVTAKTCMHLLLVYFIILLFYYFKEVNMNGKGKIQRPRDTVSDMHV
jgi:hypothetical protein